MRFFVGKDLFRGEVYLSVCCRIPRGLVWLPDDLEMLILDLRMYSVEPRRVDKTVGYVGVGEQAYTNFIAY